MLRGGFVEVLCSITLSNSDTTLEACGGSRPLTVHKETCRLSKPLEVTADARPRPPFRNLLSHPHYFTNRSAFSIVRSLFLMVGRGNRGYPELRIVR